MGFSHEKNPPRFPWGIDSRHPICAPARGALRVAIRRGAMLGAADQRRLGLSVEEPGGCAARARARFRPFLCLEMWGFTHENPSFLNGMIVGKWDKHGTMIAYNVGKTW